MKPGAKPHCGMSTLRILRQVADGLGALHVFSQIKVMHAGLRTQRGHTHGAVERQCIEHGGSGR